MITQGLTIMVVGMGTVFVFLSVLVGLMNLSASVFSNWPGEESLVDDEANSRLSEQDSLVEIAIALAAIERKQSI